MSGKYNSWGKNVMFTKPQPIYSSFSDLIKGVVIPRRWFDSGETISKEEAKKILISSIDDLEKWGVPKIVEYLEPVKTYVAQNYGDEFEDFLLSTLIRELDKEREIVKQRVWFFELKEYVEWE